MATIGSVSLRGLTQDAFNYTFLAGSSINAGDEGKAVALDTTVANTVKLAGADDIIIGNLFSIENRTVEGVKTVAVQTEGGYAFPLADSQTVNVGDYIAGGTIGGNGGGVKATATATTRSKFRCVETGVTIKGVSSIIAISV